MARPSSPPTDNSEGAAAVAPSVTDVAWMAGLLEGEGTFHRNGRLRKDGTHDWKVSIQMTDLDVIERFKRVAGVHHKLTSYEDTRKPHFQAMHRVQITGPEARRIATLVLPHMGQRRAAKIRELLAMDASRKVAA